jgi:hypothetical protein
MGERDVEALEIFLPRLGERRRIRKINLDQCSWYIHIAALRRTGRV